jgi:hypothetical protein
LGLGRQFTAVQGMAPNVLLQGCALRLSKCGGRFTLSIPELFATS